jgi:hypothetical protein
MTAYSNNNTFKATATKAKKPLRKRRPRRELPEDLSAFFIADGERPSNLDVVSGRGGGSNHHEGNKRYWRRVLAERPEYKKLGKNDNTEKNDIAKSIYDYITNTGGRFLQLDRETQKWFNLPQKIGLDKIKQALRDKYVPNFFDGESVAPLPTPSAPVTETDQDQFKSFLMNKSPVPLTDFMSTPSLDIGSILGKTSLERMGSLKSGDFLSMLAKPSTNQMIEGAWNEFPAQNGHSLDNLMRIDLIATVDNMAQVKNTPSPQVPMSLQALLQQQMESAIPSTKTVKAVQV